MRHVAQIEIGWESLAGMERGTVADISRTGCFVLCSGEVEDGENVKIYLPDDGDKIVAVWGEVVYHVYEIGFAVRFVELGDKERLFLDKLLRQLSKS